MFPKKVKVWVHWALIHFSWRAALQSILPFFIPPPTPNCMLHIPFPSTSSIPQSSAPPRTRFLSPPRMPFHSSGWRIPTLPSKHPSNEASWCLSWGSCWSSCSLFRAPTALFICTLCTEFTRKAKREAPQGRWFRRWALEQSALVQVPAVPLINTV